LCGVMTLKENGVVNKTLNKFSTHPGYLPPVLKQE